MNRQFSLFLDLLRFSASIAVFFSHAKFERFGGGDLYWFGLFGHDAVLVFFVLSGYVISYTANNKEKTIKSYVVARLSRLYSVVLPVLVLTLFISYWGSASPSPNSILDNFYAFFGSVFFLNQIWFNTLTPFGNDPFWSVSYEFWYYTIFACFFYFKGVLKYVTTAICMLIAGPKILILFPIWLLGVLAFHINKNKVFSVPVSVGAVVSLLVFYFGYRLLHGTDFMDQLTINWLGVEVYEKIDRSRHIFSDLVVGPTIFLLFVFLHSYFSQREWLWLNRSAGVVRYFSGYTFTIYLLHYPLYIVFSEMGFNIYQTMISSFFVILIFGSFTEKKKHWFKKWVELVPSMKSSALIKGKLQ